MAHLSRLFGSTSSSRKHRISRDRRHQAAYPSTLSIPALNGGAFRARWVKDYRHDRRTKPSDLADEVAHKVRDTLAGLAAASHYANVSTEHDFAIRALCQTTSFKVVLHLEQPTNPSRLHPKVADPANVQMKLKKRLHQAIDNHPKVLDRTLTQSHDYCWTVSSVPVA